MDGCCHCIRSGRQYRATLHPIPTRVFPSLPEPRKTKQFTLYTFTQSEGLLPLGEQYNPVHYVKGIESTSDYEAAVLTPEQTLKVLEQLQQPEYTMLVLVAATGMRMPITVLIL